MGAHVRSLQRSQQEWFRRQNLNDLEALYLVRRLRKLNLDVFPVALVVVDAIHNKKINKNKQNEFLSSKL